MKLTFANLNPDNLRNCDTVALGCAVTVLKQYGYTTDQFILAHPELWRPEIPAAPFRDYLISGA